jgi:hypothetical protein
MRLLERRRGEAPAGKDGGTLKVRGRMDQ